MYVKLNRKIRWREYEKMRRQSPLRKQILIALQADLLVQGFIYVFIAQPTSDLHCALKYYSS